MLRLIDTIPVLFQFWMRSFNIIVSFASLINNEGSRGRAVRVNHQPQLRVYLDIFGFTNSYIAGNMSQSSTFEQLRSSYTDLFRMTLHIC